MGINVTATKALRGRQLSFMSTVLGGPVVIDVDEDGNLTGRGTKQVAREDHGVEVVLVEVDGVAGEPDQHFYAFKGDIPPEYDEFVTEVDGEAVVPARYVRGVHMEQVSVDLPEELLQELLDSSGTGQLLVGAEGEEE